jgi:RNA recognition motif-containing protein
LPKKALFSLFGEYGNVLDIYIPFNKNATREPNRIPLNMGYAFVEMSTNEEAIASINGLHNKVCFENKNLSVRIADLR